MMPRFNVFWDLSKASVLLLFLPYLAFNSSAVFNSHFFDFPNFLYLIFSILIFEVIFKLFIIKIESKKYIYTLIFTSIFIFIYGFYLSVYFQNLFLINFEKSIRGRVVLYILFLLFYIIFLIIIKFKYIKNINIFLVFFIIINCLNTINLKVSSNFDLENWPNNFHRIELIDGSVKPVILIITDEYSSPNEFFGLYNDSSVYSFSKYLEKNNWLLRESSISYEKSTIHSVSSLFNFNLSESLNYSKADIIDIGTEKLLNSSFYDSLKSKKINFINFGIFRVGEDDPINNLYKYPENFLEVILFNTIFNHVFYNTGGLKVLGFDYNYYPMGDQNKFIFNNMTDSLNNLKKANFFSYVHLYMPHSPFFLENEFEKPLVNDINGYFEYWNFTNRKLEILLSELTRSNKYRIILSGDHGFRGDARINPNNTFTAFYGFSEKDLTTIKSVQDLGILINACY